MSGRGLNALAAETKCGDIVVRAYLTGVVMVMQPDGSFKDEYKTQWRCIVEDEVMGRGTTPDRAVASALTKVRKAVPS